MITKLSNHTWLLTQPEASGKSSIDGVSYIFFSDVI